MDGDQSTALAPLPDGPFGAILADPPWAFRNYSDRWHAEHPESRWAGKHYGLLAREDLARIPVGDVAAPDCALFMWAIGSMLPHALDLMAAWGFCYKTVAFVWTKMVKDGSRPCCGMGHWTRQSVEYVLLGTRGRPRRRSRRVQQAILQPRGRHSEKPESVQDRIEELVGGPYLELFARRARPGWACWGNEVPVKNSNQ
ncbi:MAG: hypothetical protein GF320_21455 [Armatimonadia bacterium]|nr:hypothetical protein [Armatimonadia bacterium]